MSKSPQLGAEGAVRVTVKSNGSPLPDTAQLLSVQVSHAVGEIPTARLVVLDGNMPDGAWSIADGDTFKPGAVIRIDAGYGDKEDTVFEGIVVKVGVRISGSNESRLEIECQHQAVKMAVGRKSAHFADQRDGDIIRNLVQSHGLKATVDATAVTHRACAQIDCTDWDFMRSRAELNGRLVIAEGPDTLVVKEPAFQAAPVLEVTWGNDLIELEADVDARHQYQSVEAAAWDPATQGVIHATATPSTLNAQGNLPSKALADVLGLTSYRLQTPAPLSADALTAWAKAQQIKSGLARIRGHMKFQGSALAKPGTLIELAGVGARFNGNVFVTAVEHTIAEGNWTTRAEFGLAPEWYSERADARNTSAAAGLQIGIVTRLDGDPAGEQRIQIQLPALHAEPSAVWARVVQLHASNGFGSFFMPEVGDEVVVGFFGTDSSHPVVLGSVYSSKRKPPFEIEAHNNTKAIVTRCKHRLEFDEHNHVITVTTPAHNQIVLSDKDKSMVLLDQNGNRVALHPGGITLDTPKDLALTAKGAVTIDAVGAVRISSKADVTCAGLNVACEGQVGFKGAGSATAELSAAGQTTVKGALVMIN
jgi:Rhs element Vgr protein